VATTKAITRDKNQPTALNLSSAARSPLPHFLHFRTPRSCLRSAVRCPALRLSAAGEGGSKVITKQPQALFQQNSQKSQKRSKNK
ncbi:hypothetical protein, partial [Thalassovita autumnalis]|uniref:hypothetical protein n=1 Tax=Thalassovita autumnalis TaxID=2072972 RepID=UPI001AD8F3D4